MISKKNYQYCNYLNEIKCNPYIFQIILRYVYLFLTHPLIFLDLKKIIDNFF